MARVKDLWTTGGGEKTRRHPDNGGSKSAKRWLAVWDEDGRDRGKAFWKKSDAEDYLEHIDSARCLVPDCPRMADTEPPVLLCADHRDLLVAQVTRKRPSVHDPVVYFIRNGDRVKIGWTTNMKARVASLSLPSDSVLLTIPGGPREELILHQRFARDRIGRSEWFTASPEIEEYIATRTARAA